jgi:DNA-binding transcriptional MocR family regulator
MENLKEQFDSYCKEKNVIDLTRGKPSPEQLTLSEELDGILDGNFTQDGVDIRNYGEIKGLPSARKIGSELLDYSEEFVLASSNSSLTLMGNLLLAFLFNGSGGAPWKELETISIICPVPGYDRHFALCEKLGIKMIKVPLTGDGPDMNIVEDLVRNDDSIKGIWCIPKHSNPTGEIYSNDSVKRIANLPLIGASDFIVLWDNAYAVHDFANSKKLPSIQDVSQELNTFDNVATFGSTSKITFAGGGIAFLGASDKLMTIFLDYFSKFNFSPDKVNQARHVRFLKNIKGIEAHMKKLATLIRPKFELVDKYLNSLPKGLASWTKPTGGYFISFDSKPGQATKIFELCKAAGLNLTPIGSAFPYRRDQENRNIRIAPTYVSIEELDKAMQIFVCCVKLADEKEKNLIS